MNIYEQAKDKLTTYRLEAEVQRQLPKRVWRTELARVLRTVAERLDPATPALTPDLLQN